MFGTKTMRLRIAAAALLGLGLIPGTSRATLTISLGNGPPNTTLNLDQATGFTGTTFTESATGLGTVLQLTTDVTGVVSGSGQAKVDAQSTNFSTVTFAVAGGYLGWTGFETNLNFSDNGSFTVTGVDQFGNPTSKTFAADKNGQNFFNISTDMIQYITSVTVNTSPAAILSGVEQTRIGDVVTTAAVPEPATMGAALSGLGILGLYGLRRRLRRPAVA